MSTRHVFAATLLLAGGMLAHPHPARAAQSYDNCAGTISSLPAVITTQGVWCLKKDLGTAITSGNSITIATNNVTIDCNDFKLGGLAAGDGSQAFGIYAANRQNATVRHCNVRGFLEGIALQGGAGHLVEDNRLDNNLYTGIEVTAAHSLVRRNRVYDTGGSTGSPFSYGISTHADLDGNIVDGLFTAETTLAVYGIYSRGTGTQVVGNRIGGLLLNGGGKAFGIYVDGAPQSITDNRILADAAGTSGNGIRGSDSTRKYCSRNTISGFTLALSNCFDAGDNVLD